MTFSKETQGAGQGPEQTVAEKQKSVLRQILDVFEQYHGNYGTPGTGIFIQGANLNTTEYPTTEIATIMISPTNSILDREQLESFAGGIHRELMEKVKSATPLRSMSTITVDKKGGFTFPVIICDNEVVKRIATNTTTLIGDVPNASLHQPSATVDVRRSTFVMVYPNQQIAELAWIDLIEKDKKDSLPKKFRKPYLRFKSDTAGVTIGTGITGEQLKLFREVTLSFRS